MEIQEIDKLFENKVYVNHRRCSAISGYSFICKGGEGNNIKCISEKNHQTI